MAALIESAAVACTESGTFTSSNAIAVSIEFRLRMAIRSRVPDDTWTARRVHRSGLPGNGVVAGGAGRDATAPRGRLSPSAQAVPFADRKAQIEKADRMTKAQAETHTGMAMSAT